MKKIAVLIFASFISFGLFYSCVENSKNTADVDEMEQASLFKLSSVLMTPDSLQTAEDNALFQKMEAFVYEGIEVKDGRFEIIFGKEDLKKRGISDVYYNSVKKEVTDVNNYLDTISVFWRNSMIEAFMKSREEYLAKLPVK